MINIFKSNESVLESRSTLEPGCWVSVVEPTPEDCIWLRDELQVEPEFISAMLDDEERSHVDFDDDSGHTLVILDSPCIEDKVDTVDAGVTQYDTHPLSVLFLPDKELIVTLSLRKSTTVDRFESGACKELRTHQRTQMLLLLMLYAAQRYQVALRDVDRQFKKNEQQLRAHMRNQEMMRMLGLEHTLVYFAISLRAVESTLEKVCSGRYVKMFEEDKDLADDVSIEYRQAVEMCEISSKLLNETMTAFSNIINNSMNDSMKRLTVITLVLAVPTVIFSFYGMNVDNLPLVDTWLWAAGIALFACVIAGLIFAKSKFFK